MSRRKAAVGSSSEIKKYYGCIQIRVTLTNEKKLVSNS